jgi:hypothetical protein
MAAYNDNGIKTFTAGEALERYRRVKLNAAGTAVVYADADEACIGITERKVDNAEQVAVRLINHQGTFLVVASAAIDISADATLEGTADGKVATQNAGTIRFTALNDAAGDGSIIEVLPTTLA